MAGKAIMFQGTGSDVGKSLIVAGLARALANQGYKVRPFKPQNMSNNAAVTLDGGEIGRAQALQARAARTPPVTDMNPVLLKPQSERGSQLIVQGKVAGTIEASAYQNMKSGLMSAVLDSFERLKNEADFVLVEGAGSASEINLRRNDLANMGFARAAGVPVILIGDIDRGGVIASLVGTREVIEKADREMIAGFLVNRFRGDPQLFASGMELIAKKTGWRSFGLVPHFKDAHLLPAEDALGLHGSSSFAGAAKSGDPSGRTKIAVPILPHIANFDDLDPLLAEPGVIVLKIRPGDVLPPETDLVILCGSKSTLADLTALREAGLDIDIAAHVRRGGHVLGICGGYQMMGRTIADPHGIEGKAQRLEGLGLLEVHTTLSRQKQLVRVNGHSWDGAPLEGYEMHMGEMTGPDLAHPFARLDTGKGESRNDGVVKCGGRLCGTYVHGLFATTAQRTGWLTRLGGPPSTLDHDRRTEQTLDALANHLETHMDIEGIIGI